MRLEISLMGIEIILFIIIGAFTGGFVSGLSGFGTGLFALGWWFAVMPPIDAVIVVVIMSLVGGRAFTLYEKRLIWLTCGGFYCLH